MMMCTIFGTEINLIKYFPNYIIIIMQYIYVQYFPGVFKETVELHTQNKVSY